jgi:hypothetical protein
VGATRRRSRGGRPGRLAAQLIGVAVLTAACAESGAVGRYNRDACRLANDSTVVFNGVRDYLMDASPTPQRFLYVPGTDSSPPDAGILALQDKGPTYMYPASGDQQAIVKTKLTSIGDYASLLVAYHGFQRKDPQHGTIRLSGTYISGKADGKTIPVRDFPLECDSAGWHGPKPVPHLVAPPTPPPGASH